MERICVKTGKKYEVLINTGFDGLQQELSRLFSADTGMFIVSDDNVGKLYGDEMSNLISNSFSRTYAFSFSHGENNKSLETLSQIYKFLLANSAGRNSAIIALGGGVTGDLAGFAAATYMRGISYVQVPTTLLAQVDSSVGGKTAVDFAGYKNMIGSFHQPALVYINVHTLTTLPEREFSAGMAEVVKYGLIADADFYAYLTDNVNRINATEALIKIIHKCVSLKAEIVRQDECDRGIREILNFGHTAGHAIEALAGFGLLHGECVALGMLAAMELSVIRGCVSSDKRDRLRSLLQSLGLPIKSDTSDAERIYDAMRKDKKAAGGSVRCILLKEIGRAEGVSGIERKQIINALESIGC